MRPTTPRPRAPPGALAAAGRAGRHDHRDLVVRPGPDAGPGRVDPGVPARIAEVLRHPRCLNCHPSGDFPRQADDRHRHRMLVMRGPDDRGNADPAVLDLPPDGQHPDGLVPGAPHWRLAPRSMGWEGLSDAELCRALKDPAQNKGRTVPALVEHMTGDALVQWAWQPGARTRAARRPAGVPRARAALGGDGRGLPAVRRARPNGSAFSASAPRWHDAGADRRGAVGTR